MEVHAELDSDRPPQAVLPWVEALDTYPRWLTIITKAERLDDDERGAAWSVDLTARLGPFARSKRLRMVRTVHTPRTVVFERDELDDRKHAAWILTADVRPLATGSHLSMQLHYGGSLWGPVLERVLRDEIERARPKLAALIDGG